MSRIGRHPRTGGRGKLLNEEQEQEICNMVMGNNAITLRQIRAAILQDNAIFQNINSVRVKELRYQYVQVSQLLVVYHYNLFTIKQLFPNFFGFSTPFYLISEPKYLLYMTSTFCLKLQQKTAA